MNHSFSLSYWSLMRHQNKQSNGCLFAALGTLNVLLTLLSLSYYNVLACNCHRHSFDCYYDPDVDRRRASLDLHRHHRGGGVCLNCQVSGTPQLCKAVCLWVVQINVVQIKSNEICLLQHHTTGVNCERCIPTYYRSPDHPIDSPLACSREIQLSDYFSISIIPYL